MGSNMNNLISIYKKCFNLLDASFTPIEHEDAIVAIVFKVTKGDGSTYILKVCPRENDYACESYFLHFFDNKIPVPHIIALNAPDTYSYGAILMEHINGTLLQQNDLTSILANELGSLLAKIHLNKAAGYGDLTKPENLSRDPAAYFTFKFNEGMSECADHLPPVILKACRHFYNSNIHLLRIVDGPLIIHRDFRPGNVIINDGCVQGIIDWSSARSGFAEEDLAFLEYGGWSLNENIKKSFISGYENIRPLPDFVAVLPLLKLSKAIATIGFTVKTQTWSSKNASLYQYHRLILDNLLSK